MNKKALNAVWESYEETKSKEDRDKLIVYYMSLVEYIASKIGSGLPSNIDIGDLINYGVFGLIDAIGKFDATKGYKFETYASTRIRGAILDGLRATDWVPRSVRAKVRQVDQANSRLTGQLGRLPTEDELASELSLSPKSLHKILQQASLSNIEPLDQNFINDDGDEAASLSDMLEAREFSPTQSHALNEFSQKMAQSTDGLSQKEKIVLTLHYYEGLTFSEIGQVLNVTESRICQIHAKAVGDLKAGFSSDILGN